MVQDNLYSFAQAQLSPQGKAPLAGTDVYFWSRGVKLHGRFYEAQGKVKGNFLLLHGLTSNSSWFEKISYKLMKEGYNVLTYDRRGSGKSEGPRGDIPSSEAFFWDMKAALDFLGSTSALSTHVIAFSYSWKLPPLYIRKFESSKIESLIFVAPASDVQDSIKPTFWDKLKIFLNIDGPYFESPVKDTHLTQDPKTLNWIKDTEKSRLQQSFTRRFLLASNELDQKASHAIPEVRKPMLVFLPREDRVIDASKTRKRFLEGPYGVARKIVEIDGNHIVDSNDAQDQLVSNVLKWTQGNRAPSYML